jgi:hypothetical protein
MLPHRGSAVPVRPVHDRAAPIFDGNIDRKRWRSAHRRVASRMQRGRPNKLTDSGHGAGEGNRESEQARRSGPPLDVGLGGHLGCAAVHPGLDNPLLAGVGVHRCLRRRHECDGNRCCPHRPRLASLPHSASGPHCPTGLVVAVRKCRESTTSARVCGGWKRR